MRDYLVHSKGQYTTSLLMPSTRSNYTFTNHGVLRNDLAIDRENAAGFITVTQALLNVLCGMIQCRVKYADTTISWQKRVQYITVGTQISQTALSGLVSLAANKHHNEIAHELFPGAPYEVVSDPPLINNFTLALSRNRSMASLIEEISRNLTLSLFSVPEYL